MNETASYQSGSHVRPCNVRLSNLPSLPHTEEMINSAHLIANEVYLASNAFQFQPATIGSRVSALGS